MPLTFTFNPVSGTLDVTVKPATPAEVLAGTSTTVYISPATIAAAIQANAPVAAKLFNYYNYI